MHLGSRTPSPFVRGLVAVPVLGWAAYYGIDAFHRWSWAMRCALICPAFIDADMAPAHYRATDWTTPLLTACLPLAAIGLWALLRWLLRR